MTIKTFGNDDEKATKMNEYSFCVKGLNNGCNVYMRGFAMPFICSPLSGQRIDVVRKQFPILKGLDLADKGSEGSEIDMLIGADFYWHVLEGEMIRCGSGGLIALKSKLGWLLSGPFDSSKINDCSVNLAVTHVLKISTEVNENVDLLNRNVEKFWDLDTLGIVDKEPSVYEKFVDDISFRDNRYEVHLPFKENHPLIEDHYELSLKRLNQLKCKLDKTPGLLKEYDDVIKQQMVANVVERVESSGEIGEVTYIPHRAVIRNDKQSTKLRVVYDCSAKSRGPSLNECLYKGPSLNPLLYDVLLRFRVYNIAITADIEKAYLKISVAPKDRDYLRFLWYENIQENNFNVVKCRFTRVIFGATSSQFLLNGTVDTHVSKYEKVDPVLANKLRRHFYVDDLNSGVNNFDEGVELYKKVKFWFYEASFNVRKWRTSDIKLREFITSKEKVNDVNIKDELTICDEKVLGIVWREREDNLIIDLRDYVMEAESYRVTKRNVLKVIAGFYDPVGWVQPVILKFKILFQEVCRESTAWDDELSECFKLKWYKIITEMKGIREIIIPRCYCFNKHADPIINIELHCFSDSSELAYGGCIYLKFILSSGAVKVTLVTSKTRIVPLNKKIMIPRLELLGNLLLSKLVVSVLSALKEELCINGVYLWSDSKISLAWIWIKAENKEFKTFIQNRVIVIRKNTQEFEWNYCRSVDNPADINYHERKS